MTEKQFNGLGVAHSECPEGPYALTVEDGRMTMRGRSGVLLAGGSVHREPSPVLITFLAVAHERFPALLAEVRRLRHLMESIGRDALRELPAVEEALRQERERVVAILKGHLTRCDEKARTIGKATPAWDMAVGACSALDKAIERVNGG